MKKIAPKPTVQPTSRAMPKGKRGTTGKSTRPKSDGRPVFERVYDIVLRIPRGRVLTYGTISDLLEGKLTPQGVGWALRALPEGTKIDKKTGSASRYSSKSVPWHRVINSKGGTSTHKIGDIPPDLQRQLLEAEGVRFDDEQKVDLKRYLWVAGLASLR